MGEEKSLTFADRMVIGGRILSDQLVLGDLKALFRGLDVGPQKAVGGGNRGLKSCMQHAQPKKKG